MQSTNGDKKRDLTAGGSSRNRPNFPPTMSSVRVDFEHPTTSQKSFPIIVLLSADRFPRSWDSNMPAQVGYFLPKTDQFAGRPMQLAPAYG